MKNRAVRIALLLLAVLAFAGAGYELGLAENQATAARQAAEAFQQKALRLTTAVRELRAAEYAYVAPGQGTEFWTSRAATLLSAIAADLPNLCAAVVPDNPAKPASASCTEAQDDLAVVERIDASVRGYLREDQALPAADIVFGKLREANQALAAHIDEVRVGQAAADAEAATALRTRQLATVGGAALFAVLILLLLTPGGASDAAARSESSGILPLSSESQATGTGVSAGVSPARPNVATGPQNTGVTTAGPRPAPAALSGAADLGQAARLCTDFAQLQEAADLRGLLGRVAELLHAAGVVVWVEDPASGMLRPSLSHGYPAHALARMRSISRDDDNATAIAFRQRVLHVVAGDGTGNGAIAVPLLAPGGCVGVMAAEIRGGLECDSSTQALATIVAAQLATLVHPQAAPERDDSDFRLQLDG
jgi:hypothetical protein